MQWVLPFFPPLFYVVFLPYSFKQISTFWQQSVQPLFSVSGATVNMWQLPLSKACEIKYVTPHTVRGNTNNTFALDHRLSDGHGNWRLLFVWLDYYCSNTRLQCWWFKPWQWAFAHLSLIHSINDDNEASLCACPAIMPIWFQLVLRALLFSERWAVFFFFIHNIRSCDVFQTGTVVLLLEISLSIHTYINTDATEVYFCIH